MKKRTLVWMMTAALTAGMLAGCSSQSGETTAASQETVETEEILIAAAASLKNFCGDRGNSHCCSCQPEECL